MATEDRLPGLVHIEETIWVATLSTGVPLYDFAFESSFACRHPSRLEQPVTAIARMGAAQNYSQRFETLQDVGVQLIHSPEQYALTSELPRWYSKLSDLTIKSLWFDGAPDTDRINDELGWPVFLKGERQTSQHNPALARADNPSHLQSVLAQWQQDDVLHWQRVVARQWINLRKIADAVPGRMQVSEEYRCFCWRGSCVGADAYWSYADYRLDPTDRAAVTDLAESAARRIDAIFVVVDVARTAEGHWIVIEINDGQDSGYAAVNRRQIWQRIIEIERNSIENCPSISP